MMSWIYLIFSSSPWTRKNLCPCKYFQYKVYKFETYILLFIFIERNVSSCFHHVRHFHFQMQGKIWYTLRMKNLKMNNREWTTLIIPPLPHPQPHTIQCTYDYREPASPPPFPPLPPPPKTLWLNSLFYVPNIRLHLFFRGLAAFLCSKYKAAPFLQGPCRSYQYLSIFSDVYVVLDLKWN